MLLAVVISVTKEGVKFSTRGDIGTANIVCRQNTTVDKVLLLYPCNYVTPHKNINVQAVWYLVLQSNV